MLRRAIIILILTIGIFPAGAQTYQCDTLEMKVFFRRDRSDIDTTYME